VIGVVTVTSAKRVISADSVSCNNRVISSLSVIKAIRIVSVNRKFSGD
jgi:hypothetical protein